METHVKVLAILHIVLGVLILFAALVVFLIFGGLAGLAGAGAAADPDARMAAPVLGFIGLIILVVLVILSLPSLLAGYGLLHYAEWGRILALVLSFLNLLNFPLGTALGVYGIVVLFDQRTVALFQRPGAR